jgi:hypothetical protein
MASGASDQALSSSSCSLRRPPRASGSRRSRSRRCSMYSPSLRAQTVSALQKPLDARRRSGGPGHSSSGGRPPGPHHARQVPGALSQARRDDRGRRPDPLLPSRRWATGRGRTRSLPAGRPSTASPRPALTAGTPRTSNRGAAPTATSGGRRGWGEEGGPGGTTLGRSRLATRRAVRPRRGTGPRRLDVAGRPRLEAAPLRTAASIARPGGGASRASSEGRLQSLGARGFRQRGGHTTRESQREDCEPDQEREHAGASEREGLLRGAGGAFERVEVARAPGVDAHAYFFGLGSAFGAGRLDSSFGGHTSGRVGGRVGRRPTSAAAPSAPA